MPMNADLRRLFRLNESSGIYIAATFINNAIPLLVLPVLTRYLAPGQYANVALFSLCMVVLNSLTVFSIPNMISKHFFDSQRPDLAGLISGSLIILAAISSVAVLLILLFHPLLRRALELGLPWLALVPLASFASGVFAVGLTVMRNEKKARLFSRHQVGNTVIDVAASLLMVVLLLWGWRGRVGGIVVSYSVSAVLMVLFLKANGYLSWAGGMGAVGRILRLIVPLMPHSFQSVVIYQAGLLFIQLYFTMDVLGLYAVALQVAFAVRLLNTALALAWTPYLYEQLARKQTVDKVFISRMLLLLAAVMSAGVAFIVIFSKTILGIMTGSRYLAAGEFIPWLALGYFFQGLCTFLTPILIKLERQNYISLVSFLNMLSMLALNVLLIKAFGRIGAAYAFSIVYLLMFLALSVKAQRIFPLPWRRAFRAAA
jgi:O-antigen/teichoic acid export membrane protein